MRAKDYHFFEKEEKNIVDQFVSNINWEPLHEHFQKLGFDTPLNISLGIDCCKHYTVYIRGTQNLVDRVGIMVPCLESVYLQDSRTCLYQEIDYEKDLRQAPIGNGELDERWADFDAVFGPIVLQINFDLCYTIKNGLGRYGFPLFWAEYKADEGWTFHEQ